MTKLTRSRLGHEAVADVTRLAQELVRDHPTLLYGLADHLRSLASHVEDRAAELEDDDD